MSGSSASPRPLLAPISPTIILNDGEVIDVGPGESAQPLHRDDDAWNFAHPDGPMMMNTIAALVDIAPEMGGTLVVPGSHRWDVDRTPAADEIAACTLPAGSCLVFRGDTLHAGGPTPPTTGGGGPCPPATAAAGCARWRTATPMCLPRPPAGCPGGPRSCWATPSTTPRPSAGATSATTTWGIPCSCWPNVGPQSEGAIVRAAVFDQPGQPLRITDRPRPRTRSG